MTRASLREALLRFARHPGARRGFSILCAAAATRRGPPLRPWKACLLILAPIALLAVSIFWGRMTEVELEESDHSAYSVEIAVNRVLFGAPSHLSSRRPSVASSLLDPALRSRPLLERPEALAGTRDAYRASLCAFRNNENVLMLLVEAALRLRPGLTLSGLVAAAALLQTAALLASCLVFLRAGAGPFLVAGALFVALAACSVVNPRYAVSPHALLLPFTLLLVALLTLALLHLRSRLAWGRAAAVFGALGLFAGLFVNLRTSYLPIVAALSALLLVRVAGLFRGIAPLVRRRALIASSLAGAFLAGSVLFHLAAIRPLQKPSEIEMGSHHVVWHSVVLALALPPNDLSRREGIEWLDARGLDLARRVDPEARLGPRYEPALRAYYLGLWKRHPGDMLTVYAAKVGLAGTGACAFGETELLPSSDWTRRALGLLTIPLGLIPSGFWLFGFSLLVFAGSLILARVRSEWTFLFPLAALALAACLLFLESALIVPQFTILYHAPWLFWVAFSPLVLGQGLLDAALWALRRRLEPPPVAPATPSAP